MTVDALTIRDPTLRLVHRRHPRAASLVLGGVLLLLWPLACGTASALSNEDVHEQSQTWWSLNSTARINDRWGMVGDFHIRRDDFLNDPSFYFLRTGMHWWATEKLTLTFGYAHMWKAPAEPGWDDYTNEERLYEQAQHALKIGPVSVLNRVRNEQRWQQDVDDAGRAGGYSFTNRLRYLLSLTVALSDNPSLPAPVVSDEVLIHFGPGVDGNTFDQNRLFVGIRQRLGPRWSFDFGYMPVLQQKSGGDRYDLNHTMRLFWYFTPDLREHPSEHEPATGAE